MKRNEPNHGLTHTAVLCGPRLGFRSENVQLFLPLAEIGIVRSEDLVGDRFTCS